MLDPDGTVRAGVDHIEWALFFEKIENRRIVCDKLVLADGSMVEVSTVFIGMEGEIFETMIFGGSDEVDHYQLRCNTLDEAFLEAGYALGLVMKAHPDAKIVDHYMREFGGAEAPQVIDRVKPDHPIYSDYDAVAGF